MQSKLNYNITWSGLFNPVPCKQVCLAFYLIYAQNTNLLIALTKLIKGSSICCVSLKIGMTFRNVRSQTKPLDSVDIYWDRVLTYYQGCNQSLHHCYYAALIILHCEFGVFSSFLTIRNLFYNAHFCQNSHTVSQYQ